MKEISKLLVVVDCKDLYHFLKLDRGTAPAVLCEEAEKRVRSIQSKGRRGADWDAKKELASKCKTIFKNAETKAEYDRYLDEQAAQAGAGEGTTRSQESNIERSALLKSGMDSLNQGYPKEAVRIAKLLTGIDDPQVSTFRLNVAQRLLDTGDHAEAFDFIEWCRKREADADEYELMLGIFFAQEGIATWSTDPKTKQSFAHAHEHIVEAEACLEMAQAHAGRYGKDDHKLDLALASLRGHLEVATQNKWAGNTLATAAALLMGVVAALAAIGSGLGALAGGFSTMLLVGVSTYIASSFEPTWKVNERIFKADGEVEPLFYLIKAFFLFATMHIVGPFKLCSKFVIPFVAARLEPYAGEWARAASWLALVVGGYVLVVILGAVVALLTAVFG